MTDIWVPLVLTVLAGLATSIGGMIGVAGRGDSRRLMSMGLGFSAGVMIYVPLVEILPKGREALISEFGDAAGEWLVLLAFFGGIAVIALIDRLVPEEINPHEPGTVDDRARQRALMRTGILTAIALGVHNFPEGFATFIAAIQNPEIGVAVAVAIAIHNIPEGLAGAGVSGHRFEAQGAALGDCVGSCRTRWRDRRLFAVDAVYFGWPVRRGVCGDCRRNGVHLAR